MMMLQTLYIEEIDLSFWMPPMRALQILCQISLAILVGGTVRQMIGV